MTNVKMKAVDTMHVSAAGSENIEGGETFEVNETEARQLEERGLATRVGGAKAESAAPANKMQADPANKAIGSIGTKQPVAQSVTRKDK